MGNAIKYLFSKCCKSTAAGDTGLLRSDGMSASAGGVSALAEDILNFENTSKVPEGLGEHVVSSKNAQANWYRKLAEAWKEANPPPKTPEEASKFVIKTLKRHLKADVKGLLSYYGLPLASDLDDDPEEVKFELQTLPVDEKAIPDGDTMTVYVDTTYPRESSLIPEEVQTAADQRSRARAQKDYDKADDLHKIIIDAGYRMITSENDAEILAKKYRIRFSGIDTPESKMPYGKEAKEELVSIVAGNSVKVLVYTEDRYGRFVGDVYCNGEFVQEIMLKKGFAWHYTAYDKRPELAKWEKEARTKRAGLWAQPNPEAPWDWRKNRREGN